MMFTSPRFVTGLAFATWLVGCSSSADSASPKDSGADADIEIDGGSDPGDGGAAVCGEAGVELSVASLEDLATLRGCGTFRGSLRVADTILPNVDGLESLRVVEGQINFFRNSKLANLDGLKNLETVREGLLVHHNPGLVELAGLAKLRSVEGELFIASNDGLEGLRGLERLGSVGKLQLGSNARLSSLQGLAGLTTVRGDLTIQGNPSLLQTEAEALAARLDVGGKVDVSGNKPPP